VIGLKGQENYFHNKQPRPAIISPIRFYEPSLTAIVTIRASVQPEEEVELGSAKKKLFPRCPCIGQDRIGQGARSSCHPDCLDG